MRLVAVPSLACAAAIALIAVFAREHAPAPSALAALAILGLGGVPFARAWREQPNPRRERVQLAALAVFGLLTAPVGWMFGASSAFAALLTLAILVVGVRYSARGAWTFYATVAAGQAAVAALVLVGVLADASLLPLIVPGHPMWHHWIAHGAIQLVYITALLAGRGFQSRYRRLSADLDAAIQVAARRASLLDEARAEYLRTLALGRQGIFSGHTVGTFRLGELIGRGGAGEVYDARAEDGTVLAVKLVRGDRLRDPAAIQAFIAEASAAMKIDSPHVVRARQVGGLDAEVPFIAMDKLDGVDLRARIAERGALSRPELRALASDACAALAAVHAAGLVHGDVSPANLIATRDGWKLIDLGGARGGTPRFTAPEQIASSDAAATPASDVYSLAACLYAAATGEEPFAESAAAQLAHAVTTRLPLDPRLSADVSDDVASVLLLGLARAPAERLAGALALRDAFTAALDGALPPAVRQRSAALPAWSVAPPRPESDTTDVAAREQRALRASTPAIARPAATPDGPAIWRSNVVLVAREATASPAGVLAPAPEATPASTTTELTPSREHSDARFDATRDAAWQGALQDKLRRQRIGVLALCLGGAVLLGFIIRERPALVAAWIGIAGIAVAMYADRAAELRPWVIVAALSVGPAFALGLHSGFAAIIALGLFAGRLFRAPWKRSWSPSSWRAALDSDGAPLVAILVGQTIAFLLVVAGLVGDLGNTPISYPGLPPAASWCLHALFMLVYVAVFATAASIDRNFEQLVRKNEIALRDAAQKAALLSTARAELDRALAGEVGGLFTGSTIGGYSVDRLVGRGGMGEVYAARKGNTVVALKVIRADRIAAQNLRRFAREAHTLQRVDSPYVSRVLEVGADERVPFLAMELVEGATLTELLRGRERLDVDATRAMVRDISRGLEDVHRAGVLHRDVKPSNLVRTPGDRWKLVDFGIAKFVDAPSETTGSLVIGTPPFMAPEQIAGGTVDARSDVFSLCAVIYRALTGRAAWTTETALAAVRPQPTDPAPVVGDDLALALRIGLATRAADRFATSTELGAAFDAAFAGRLDDGLRRRAQAILAREPWA